MKKWFWSKRALMILLMMNALIFLFLGTLLLFFSIEDQAYVLLEISMLIFTVSLTTYIYSEYNRETLLKRIRINNQTKKALQVNLFAIVFIWGIIYILVWLLWVYLLSISGWSFVNSSVLITGNDEIIWSNVVLEMYFYLAICELLIIITFAYFLNHFIKRKLFLYGILIALGVYLLIFQDFYGFSNLWLKSKDGIGNFYWRNDNAKAKIAFQSFFLPWTQFGLFGKNLFLRTDIVYDKINWFHLSNMNDRYATTFSSIYENILWIPFVYGFGYVTIPMLHDLFRK